METGQPSCGLATSIYLDYNFYLFCTVRLSSDRHFTEIPSLVLLQDLHVSLRIALLSTTVDPFKNRLRLTGAAS